MLESLFDKGLKACNVIHVFSCEFCEYFMKTYFEQHLRRLLLDYKEAVVRRCSVKKVFLKISQNSQELPVPESFFNAILLKKRLWHRFFPVNYAKFLRTPFFTEHLRWLLLTIVVSTYISST